MPLGRGKAAPDGNTVNTGCSCSIAVYPGVPGRARYSRTARCCTMSCHLSAVSALNTRRRRRHVQRPSDKPPSSARPADCPVSRRRATASGRVSIASCTQSSASCQSPMVRIRPARMRSRSAAIAAATARAASLSWSISSQRPRTARTVAARERPKPGHRVLGGNLMASSRSSSSQGDVEAACLITLGPRCTGPSK